MIVPPLPAQPSAESTLSREGRGFGAEAVLLAGAAGRLLGWRPAEFWDSTPAELATALGADAGAGVGRELIDALSAQFPD